MTPTHTELMLAQLVLLQRNYDVLMAILSNVRPDLADEIFDAHEAGSLKNPSLIIPNYDEDADESLELDKPEHDHVERKVPPAPPRPAPLPSPVERN